jgi:hypothetical protein
MLTNRIDDLFVRQAFDHAIIWGQEGNAGTLVELSKKA